ASHSGQRAQVTQVSSQTSSGRGKTQRRSHRSTDRPQTTFSRPTHKLRVFPINAPVYCQPRTNTSRFPARNYERPAPYRLSDVRGRHPDPAPIVPVIPGAGLGVWWGPHDSRNLSERCIGKQTIKRAELMAILRLLETIEITVKRRLLIRTTSDYCIKCVKMIQKTSSGKPVKNGGIIRCIAKYLEPRANFGQQVVIAYAHIRKTDLENDGA
ncbi:hypothetical protein GALMADRAFT_249539, partial [Galerina marginata CBS 339.88]